MAFLRNSVLLGCIPFVLATTGCSSGSGPSETELVALQSTALAITFNAHEHVGDVHSGVDAYPASKPFHVSQISEAIEVPVRDCTQDGLYEMEKQMALNEAASDPTGQTVPVKFSFSFGRKHDALAKYANMRAVLSENNGGTSYIPVGGKLKASYKKGWHGYYTADNREVARQYRTGERCFFSTIQIDPGSFNISRDKFDFIQLTKEDIIRSEEILKKKKGYRQKEALLHHMIHYMYYGYCRPGRCAQGQAFAGEFANRLFSQVPSYDDGEPQIIKLYMADLRSEQIQHDIVRLSEDTTRGIEIDDSIDNILDVCEVHRNYYDVTKNLSLPACVNGYTFDPIQGAVQLVQNILSHDVDGTMLSSQYTPIVIDLDGDGVKTSSVRWGTYFNMASLGNVDGVGQAHRTAWLGGDYVDYNQGGVDPRVNMDVRLQSRDGFLVVPDDNGQVTSSTQMFGDNMMVGGRFYENGFEALKAFAGKDCDSEETQDHYIGPWDGDLYSDRLKIWVDEDRDGVSEEGEIRSLRDSNIMAINACHIVHADEEDQFGNGTHLRSAVLMAEPGANWMDRMEEVIYRLRYGEGYEGEPVTFHLAIDLIFQVDEKNICPGGAKSEEDYPSLLPDPVEPTPPPMEPIPMPMPPELPPEPEPQPPAPPAPPSNF